MKRNVLANYVGQIWTALMGLAFLPVYVNELGTEAYGLIGFYALLQGWLTLLELGLSPMLGREMARFTAGTMSGEAIRTLLRTAEVICIAIALVAGLAVWLSAGWLATNWLNIERLPLDVATGAIGIMALVIVLRFPEGIYRSTLLGLQRQVWYNAANSVLATARWAGAAAVLILVSPTIEAFFLWQILVSAASVLTLAYGAHSSLPKGGGRFDLGALAPMWRFAGGMMLISLLSLLLLQLDRLLVSRFVPLSDFALYSLAATLGGALSFIAGPVSQAYYPRLTQLVAAKDDASLAAAYRQSSQLLALLTVPPAIMLAVFAPAVLLVWTGDAALSAKAAPLLSVFAVGTMFNCLMSMPYMLQLAYGWTRLTVVINALALVVMAPLLAWATPRYGALGAALTWLCVLACYGQFALNIMHRRLLPAERWPWYVHAWALPILAAAGSAFALRSIIEFSPNRIVAGIELVGAGIVVLAVTALSTPVGRTAAAGLRRRLARGAS